MLKKEAKKLIELVQKEEGSKGESILNPQTCFIVRKTDGSSQEH